MTTSRQTLTNQQLAILRDKGLVNPGEVAFVAGDLLVAENVTSGEKRVVGDSSIITESNNKRVLKG